MATTRVFLNYRRGDSAGHAGRLYDWLTARFGRQNVFRDLETIPPGADFAERIVAGVRGCDVLLSVIGPGWLSATDQTGTRRLDNPHDLVAVEITAALERSIPVIPVLVHHARMPRAEELPSGLAKLASHNPIEVRGLPRVELTPCLRGRGPCWKDQQHADPIPTRVPP